MEWKNIRQFLFSVFVRICSLNHPAETKGKFKNILNKSDIYYFDFNLTDDSLQSDQ